MDTDPNPFRNSPDSDRSASSTEAVDDTEDVNVSTTIDTTTSDASPMSEDDESGASSGVEEMPTDLDASDRSSVEDAGGGLEEPL
jgi:hypothetical protein